MTAGSFALPLDTEPMEAQSAETLPTGGGPWQYEPKWDGFRCLAFKQDDAVELRAKSGKPLGRYWLCRRWRTGDRGGKCGSITLPATGFATARSCCAGVPTSRRANARSSSFWRNARLSR
jgi:hypothetical protein